jgi:hypothetical protein
MYPDFKELLFVLNKHKVKYLVVGAYAVGYHAQPRATKDLDLLIQPAPKNAKAVYRALAEFGAPHLQSLTPADFVAKGRFFRMGVAPLAIDILSGIKGIAFNAAWKNRVSVIVDADTGLTANFISRDDLITAKLAAGRPHDLGDVEALRAAAKEVTADQPSPRSPTPRKTRKKKPRPEPR